MDLTTFKQSTKDSREYDNLRQYPLAIRQFRQNPSMKFDRPFDYRSTDTFLQRFLLTKYPIGDRDFGSPNGDLCNIFLNIMNQKEMNDVIIEMIENREWVYHPVRVFEKWHTLAKLYYDNEAYFWLILLFNRIIDPFRSLQDFSMVRIPNFNFLQRIPYRFDFEYDQAE
jgi:hypothetical protein